VLAEAGLPFAIGLGRDVWCGSLILHEITYAIRVVGLVGQDGGHPTGSSQMRSFSLKQKESLDAAEAAGIFKYKTIEQGAATGLVAAVAPEFAHTGGHYLDDCREAYVVATTPSSPSIPMGSKSGHLTQ
jgi:hypothetical protein